MFITWCNPIGINNLFNIPYIPAPIAPAATIILANPSNPAWNVGQVYPKNTPKIRHTADVIIGTNLFPPKNPKNWGTLISLNLLYKSPPTTPATTPPKAPIFILGSNEVATFFITKNPKRPANPPTPLFSSESPNPIPTAKSIAILSPKAAPPAALIQGIFNKSLSPSLNNNPKAGITAIGTIKDLPILWRKPKTFEPFLLICSFLLISFFHLV